MRRCLFRSAEWAVRGACCSARASLRRLSASQVATPESADRQSEHETEATLSRPGRVMSLVDAAMRDGGGAAVGGDGECGAAMAELRDVARRCPTSSALVHDGQRGRFWRDAPCNAELHVAVADHAARALGLPDGFRWAAGPGCGVITGSTTDALVHVLSAARAQLVRADGFIPAVKRFRQPGVDSRELTVYCHPQEAYWVQRAARLAGVVRVRSPPVPFHRDIGNYVMTAADLHQLIEDDAAQGFRPLCIVASFGTTDTTAIDDADSIAALAREAGVWVHGNSGFAAARAGIGGAPELLSRFAANCNSIAVNVGAAFLRPIRETLSITRANDVVQAQLPQPSWPTTVGAVLYYEDRRAAALALGETPAPRPAHADSAVHPAVELGNFASGWAASSTALLEAASCLTSAACAAACDRLQREAAAARFFADLVRGHRVELHGAPAFGRVLWRPAMTSPETMARIARGVAADGRGPALSLLHITANRLALFESSFVDVDCTQPRTAAATTWRRLEPYVDQYRGAGGVAAQVPST